MSAHVHEIGPFLDNAAFSSYQGGGEFKRWWKAVENSDSVAKIKAMEKAGTCKSTRAEYLLAPTEHFTRRYASVTLRHRPGEGGRLSARSASQNSLAG